MNEHKAANFYRLLAGLLIRHPQDLQLEVVETAQTITLMVTPNPDDARRLIGFQGWTVKAFKSLCHHACAKLGKKSMVVLNVPDVRQKVEAAKGPVHAREWDCAPFIDALAEATRALFELPVVVAASSNGPVTVFSLRLDAQERPRPHHDEEVRSALESIFHAAGKPSGRVIVIELNHEHDPRQPERAAVPDR
jgi:predicted RNA-binding protein YlqC (UPF0109 family)